MDAPLVLARIRHVGLIAMILSCLAIADAHAAFKPPQASIVIDARSGRELLSTNPDQQVHPASLTKMMTLYLLYDALRSGRLKMNSRIRFSRNAARQPPSKLGVRAGRSITVETAILALAVKSANDVAVAVAERLAGSEEKFAKRMNAKARALGMARTNFENASGLHDPQQVSTPRDLARLARGVLYKHSRYFKYFKAPSFRYGKRRIRTHNHFVRRYKGADGMKTGYIRASGFNLAGSAVRGGRRLIGVIVGGETAARRDLDLTGMMDAGFRIAKSLGKPRFAGIAPVAVDWRNGLPGAPPRRPGLRLPAPPKRAPSDGLFAVQVGAVASERAAADLAERRLQELGGAVAGGGASVVALRLRSGGQLYRARIAGVTGEQARNACARLRTSGRDCLVVAPSAGDARG